MGVMQRPNSNKVKRAVKKKQIWATICGVDICRLFLETFSEMSTESIARVGLRFWVAAVALTLTGCASVVRHAPPGDYLAQASVWGMKDIRAFSGTRNEAFKEDFEKLLAQGELQKRATSVLALSGGGANGAYGAGLLCGWTAHGDRPEFRIVTGISTGAIMAPFAFLGSAHDAALKDFYTSYATHDVVRIKLRPNSLASMGPLERLLEKYFDEAFLQEVAEAHRQGRRLYVGTTNLDAQRLVVWDMGKIAASQQPEAAQLFRKIILASASIPIMTSPVYFDVELDGKTYDEMHVDGGIINQVFFIYNVLEGLGEAVAERKLTLPEKYAIYIVRNGYVVPEYREIADKIAAITGRTIDTMTNEQSVGDLYRIYTFCRETNGDFNLAYIPPTHISLAKELFDPAEMGALFELGFKQAAEGYPWQKAPPGISAQAK